MSFFFGKEKIVENIQKNKYWIWFSLIQNIGSIRKQKLLEKFKTPEMIYTLSKKQLMQVEGIGEKTAENILDKSIKEKINNHLEYLKKNQIKIVTIQDEEYPKSLKQIYDYPISIYVKGNIELLNYESIAIIGSRECSNYGKDAAKYFGYYLANNNKCVVSGLAKGIDSFAHIGALGANGNTIAVLGNGLQDIYPKENRELANMIIRKGGTIISEYPLGTPPNKMNFPARNRIVSGISDGVLVVEAKEKSGTLITVDFALEQGKEIFVVPGNINSIYSVGTNRLIKEGARLVNCYEDIIKI